MKPYIRGIASCKYVLFSAEKKDEVIRSVKNITIIKEYFIHSWYASVS